MSKLWPFILSSLPLTDVLGSIGKGVGTLAVDTVTAGAAGLLPPALSRDEQQNNTPPDPA